MCNFVYGNCLSSAFVKIFVHSGTFWKHFGGYLRVTFAEIKFIENKKQWNKVSWDKKDSEFKVIDKR